MRCIILASAVAAATAAPASAAVFYEQVDNGRSCRNGCHASQVGRYSAHTRTFVKDQRVFDDFRLSADRSITTVTWRGHYEAGPASTFGDLPATPNTRSWSVTFFADDNGRPGAALHGTRLDAADVQRDLIRPITSISGHAVDWTSFTARLPTAFEALAAERYWLSVVASADSWQSHFTWSSSAIPRNGGLVLIHDSSGARFDPISNRSFSVGNDGIVAVPEPASWAMLIGGFGLVGMTARRRRAQVRISA